MARASVLDPAIILPDVDDAETNDLIAIVFADDALFQRSVSIAARFWQLDDFHLSLAWLASTQQGWGDVDYVALASFLREMV